jgi:hypothetical protein
MNSDSNKDAPAGCMKRLVGRLIFAGDLEINGEQMTGCALDIDRETLIAAKKLPMYRDCIILPMDEYTRIMAERENAISDAAQSDTDSIRALHERNELRQEIERLKKLECDMGNCPWVIQANA